MISNSLEIEYGVKSNYLPHILYENSVGNIHSVFQTSFNLVFHDQLVHVGALGTPVSAFGVNIPGNSLQQLLDRISAGNSVRYEDGKIMIDALNHEAKIKLDKLSEVDLRVSRLPIDRLDVKNNEIFRLINQIDFLGDSGVIQSAKESSMLNEFISAQPDHKKVNKAIIEHFFGRGIGLTPSGDDFISGLIMAESCFSEDSSCREELSEFLSSHSTTDVSRSYYQCLLKGYVSESFKHLLNNLSGTVEIAKARRIVKNVTNYGHTSGIDTLFGIQVALKKLIQ
ncbi:DUF2877 domain-containing protein [Cytobacillus praedii]|uniref:DUF2877 domain-containing protein n=1 Tax=Cytobacillus praedii TaxID=1742358 RepID=A0A4R1B2E4_9BACI|nr:DUF2877 domain-containing protein [Cytobacillus praedii]TCJ04697.1 DUF2877 domain-containing protein [Cytobacillus praedii]